MLKFFTVCIDWVAIQFTDKLEGPLQAPDGDSGGFETVQINSTMSYLWSSVSRLYWDTHRAAFDCSARAVVADSRYVSAFPTPRSPPKKKPARYQPGRRTIELARLTKQRPNCSKMCSLDKCCNSHHQMSRRRQSCGVSDKPNRLETGGCTRI